MTDSISDEFGPILEAFKSTLVSIDLRCVAVSLPSEDCWRNLVTSIFLSDRTVDEVRREQRAIPKIHNNSFALFHDAIPFAHSVLENITDGQLKIPLQPVGTNRIQYRKAALFRLKVNSSQEWIDDSVTWVLRTVDSGSEEARKELWSVVDGQNMLAKQFSFNSVSQMIEHFLRIRYSHNDRKDLEIAIYPPATIESLRFKGNTLEVLFKKASNLNVALQMNLGLYRGGNRAIWREYHEIAFARDECKSTSRVFKIKELLPFDALTAELLHKGLILDRASISAPLRYSTEPFLKTLDSFCSLKEFKKMLFEPEEYGGKKPQDAFEDAIAWLLSLAGFDVIRLRLGEKKFEHLYVGEKHRKGSVDIIAYEENERILLIECTTGPVDPVQVQRLADVKKYFRRKLKGYKRLPIVPILFFPRDFRKSSPSIEVMIADQSTIESIFQAVVQGNREKARSHLYYSGY